MKEADKAHKIEVTGALRDEAIAKCHEQLQAWGLTMPPVEPLVLDFGLGRFREVGLIEYWIANEIDAGYCGKFLFVFDGQTCPMHHHKKKVETFHLVKGRMKVAHGDSAREMGPGDVLLVSPSVLHSFTGIGPALLLEVSTPCIIEDNFFEDRRIPIGGNRR
ncbi:MAG: D-lyxose/D-mannose family sugar isomerase [Planctomycetia bacterium]|nr:D-lyxose/D-mannose family sugar isomerase [Planctomycetia bacterium]